MVGGAAGVVLWGTGVASSPSWSLVLSGPGAIHGISVAAPSAYAVGANGFFAAT